MISEIPETTYFGDNTAYNYDLLDSYHIENAHDKRLTVLRKVQFRNTKDGRPFIRAIFEDINGFCLVGNMFDCTDIAQIGKSVSKMLGSLVLLEYEPDYYNGSLCLRIKSIESIAENIAVKYAHSFKGEYSLAETRLRDCSIILGSLTMSEGLALFCQTHCALGALCTLSDESIYKGLRGYILEILYKLLMNKDDVAVESLIAFVYALLTWFSTRSASDANNDDSIMLFVASMMDKRVSAAAVGLGLLSDRISEFAALFSGMARVVSGDSYLLYSLYKAYVEASNVKVMEAQLPPGGFCSYKTYTIRRS